MKRSMRSLGIAGLIAGVAMLSQGQQPDSAVDVELRNTIPQVYKRWLNRVFTFAYRVNEKVGPLDQPLSEVNSEMRLTIDPESGRYVVECWTHLGDKGVNTRFGFCRWDGNVSAIGSRLQMPLGRLQGRAVKGLGSALIGLPQCDNITLRKGETHCGFADIVRRAVGLTVAGRGTVDWLTDFLKEPHLRVEDRRLPLIHELTLVGGGNRVSFDADVGLLRRSTMIERGLATLWTVEAFTQDHLPAEIILSTGEKGQDPAVETHFWAKEGMCRIITREQFEDHAAAVSRWRGSDRQDG